MVTEQGEHLLKRVAKILLIAYRLPLNPIGFYQNARLRTRYF